MYNKEELTKDMEASYTAARYLEEARRLCIHARRDAIEEDMFLRRKGLYGKLQNEMVPIGYFCRHYFKSNPEQVQIALKVGNQSHEATVTDSRADSSGIEYIEVTSIEDDQEHKSRTKMSERINQTHPEPITISRRLRDFYELINKAITAKSSNVAYPPNTALLMFSHIAYSRDVYLEFEFENAWYYRPLLDGRFKYAFILDRETLFQL
ncbi:hypothetical protein [Lysobacter enzymogenes]|uniref:hypothetical protein n=1 Tax=Lysobacter enzymogenes TaxID=69 RepID=UPI00099D5423|nr:hypothetical protein [Lysobacter enzymogenes]UZW62372.1 hypothetical protein BV903_008820 [Lysobacter enzymogenes]